MEYIFQVHIIFCTESNPFRLRQTLKSREDELLKLNNSSVRLVCYCYLFYYSRKSPKRMRPKPTACGLAKIVTKCCSVTWQTDLHLHCREWDELLSSGDWEPEIIAVKIPEFLRFVKKVQSLVLREMRT